MEDQPKTNPEDFMDVSSRLDSTVCDLNPSFADTLKGNVLPLSVYPTPDLLDGALFTVSNGTCENQNIPAKWQLAVELVLQTFVNIAQSPQTPEKFFSDLIEAYINLYEIHLHLIVYHGGQYQIFDENKFSKLNEEPHNQDNHAFLLCNVDNTTYYPLYVNHDDGYKNTVFKGNELSISARVKLFIEQTNEELQTHAEENITSLDSDHGGMAVDENPAVTNTSSATISQQTQDSVTVYEFIEGCLQRVNELKDRLKLELSGTYVANKASEYQIPDIHPSTSRINAELIQLQLLFIAHSIQFLAPSVILSEDNSSDTSNDNQENIVQRNETENSANTEKLLSHTTDIPQTSNVPPILSHISPTILIQPKRIWYYRSMRDLGKKEIPLLNGEGPERTPVRVGVPAQGNERMYLGVKIQTHDDQDHPSKIVVPEKTTVSLDSFVKDNNLNQLQFGQCNRTDHFDPAQRCVYLEISSKEHDARQKDVRVIMFNLYQSGSISRQLIKEGQLRKCKLAFWLCTLTNGVFEPVSPISQTHLIE